MSETGPGQPTMAGRSVMAQARSSERPAGPGEASDPRHWLEAIGPWTAAGVPLLVTLWRITASPQWRDDLPIVRGLGLVPVGGEGAISTVLMQLLAIVPIGGRVLRAGAVSAVGAALAALALYEVARRLMASNARAPGLGAGLAIAAALLATLCPSWQIEGTVAGGATIAALLVWITLLAERDASRVDARVWLSTGLLAGLTLAESFVAAAVVLVAIGARLLASRRLPPRRGLLLLGGGLSVGALWCGLLALLRPFAARAWVDFGRDPLRAGFTSDFLAERPGALAVWMAELGLLPLVLAAGAAAWGLARRQTRVLAVPLVVLVVADALFPATRVARLSVDPLIPLRLLALGSLAALVALGIHTLALGLRRSRVPLAQPIAVLLVVGAFTLVLVTMEDSGHLANRRGKVAAEIWTDEAFTALPPRSLVLVRSEAVAWRLWSARVVRGERPDVVVVPMHLLSRGTVARRLLGMEPAMAGLVRDMAIAGRPSEYSLSALADARPLYVELDPTWDRRLFDHLVPGTMWIRFAPHALGRSDRRLALEREKSAFERVWGSASDPIQRDEATLAMLMLRGRDRAVALAALGDRRSVGATLEALRRVDGADPVLAELSHRLDRGRGRVDIAGLLR